MLTAMSNRKFSVDTSCYEAINERRNIMSGHTWANAERDKCEICGDKDYMADKFCSKNPEVKAEYDLWIAEERQNSNHREAEKSL